MKREVIFRSEASADVAEAFSWYESRQPGLGREFESALDTTLGLLRNVPEAGPVVYRDLRRALLNRFPFALYYRLTPERLEVVAVLHMRRGPSRWRDRA